MMELDQGDAGKVLPPSDTSIFSLPPFRFGFLPFPIQIWDFPGQIDFFDPAFDSEHIFGGCGALIFVIDAQDDYHQALIKLHQTVTRAYQVNQNIRFEVFIHKVGVVIERWVWSCH